MLAFVTGATGFVGSHVARALAAQGADLRLLVRTNSNTKNIDDLKVDRVIGDLRDAHRWRRELPDAMLFFTLPLITGCGCAIPRRCIGANVEGTRAILEASHRNKVRRVVYTSSVATMGFTSNGQPADEDSPVCSIT